MLDVLAVTQSPFAALSVNFARVLLGGRGDAERSEA